ncbi:MAG: fatty acid desaturase [Deltaproteobacteria bacterium]|nr:fatty acid desaturase [Deltaproteobacteria bacterium]
MKDEIYFCADPKFSRLKLKDLSPEKRRAIRDLHSRENLHNLRLVLFLAIYGIAAYLMWTRDDLLVQIAGSASIVSAMVGLTVMVHEASHKPLFKSTALNNFVVMLCGLPILLPVSAFRTNHKGHHARRSSKVDPDEVAFPRLERLRSRSAYFVAFLAKASAFITVLPVSSVIRSDGRTRVQTMAEYTSLAAFLASLFWLVPLAAMWKLWLLPLLITAIFTQLRAIAEHGATTRGDVFTATRTIVSNRFLSFMMCNINYHLEHHLFPAVPWYNLPRIHQLLKDEYRRAGCSVYRSYTEFFRDFFKAFRSGLVPNTRLIAHEFREEACGQPAGQ